MFNSEFICFFFSIDYQKYNYIKTKNEERWITTCLDNFSQSYKNFEVKLLSNIRIYRKYRIKYKIKFIPGKAINDAIKISSGKIIVCLSAHCILVIITG